MNKRPCQICGCEPYGDHSDEERRRHFKVIKAAFDQWPERELLQYDVTNLETFRAFIYVCAKHRETFEFDLEKDPMRVADFLTTLKAASGKPVFKSMDSPDTVKIHIAKSVRKKVCDHKAFWPVNQAVNDLIERKLKCTTEELLTQTENAA